MADQDVRDVRQSGFEALGIERVRYLVPGTGTSSRGQSAEVSGFMKRAATAGTEVLVHFTARRGCYKNGRYSRARSAAAPSVQDLQEDVQALPQASSRDAKTFGVWNEANHVSQPTARKPGSPRSTSSPPARPAALQARRRRRARRLEHGVLADAVQAQRQGQGPDLGPAQLLRRQPQALHRHARLLRTVARRGVADRDRRDPEVPAGVPALREAPGGADEVHVQAGRPLRLARQRHALAASRGSTTTSGRARRGAPASTPGSWTPTARRARRTRRSSSSRPSTTSSRRVSLAAASRTRRPGPPPR